MVAYCALGLLWLTIRSFDACLGRAPDRIGRSPLMANILVFWAGAIGVVCAAGAITVWVEGIIPQSLSFEKFVVLFGGVSVAMIGVLMLTVVAIFDTPAERSTASAAVLARWWRTFRLALILALGPGLLALALATVRTIDEGMPVPPLPTTFPALRPATLGYRLIGVSLLVATILAHGAAMTAVGVFLSLWTKRRGRAFAIGVGLFLFAAFVWPFLLFFGGPAQYGLNLSMMTFLAAAVSLVVPLVTREPQLSGIVEWAMAWVVLLILLTIGVLWRTSRMLNRRSAQLRAHDALVTSGSVIKPRVAHEAFSGN